MQWDTCWQSLKRTLHTILKSDITIQKRNIDNTFSNKIQNRIITAISFSFDIKFNKVAYQAMIMNLFLTASYTSGLMLY